MKFLLSIVLLVGLSCTTADAACSGGGTTWSCTAGSTAANVNTAIGSSADGATITMASGSYSWTAGITFSSAKATTLICATVGGCTVTGAGILGENGSCSGNSTKLQRVSGFRFSGGNNPRFWWYGSGACTRVIRIDHNTFTGMGDSATIMYFGENGSANNYFYGVMDHNTASSSSSFYFAQFLNGNSDGAPVGSLGGPNNMFIENNTWTVTNMTNSGTGCVDGWGGHAVVVRYNTATNCRILMHGVTHTWGPRNFEVYNNTITHTSGSALGDGYRSIHHQGSGTFMAFNNTVNTFSGQSGSTIALLHYRSWTSGSGSARCTGTVAVDGNRSPTNPNYGYPCKRQPGRDPAASLFPVYAFGNKFGNQVRIDLSCEGQGESNPNTCVNHVVNNRDYYNAPGGAQTSPTSPFNGSSGVGFGTIANRPTTCSVGGTQAADAGRGGVAYYAIDAAHSVRLTWSASTDNVGVVGYKVYRDNVQIGTAPTPLYIDNAASPSAHNYTVSAYDAAGNESARSAPVSITVTPGTGSGVLYRCASTNTWAVHYSPYSYPHPMTLQP
jgi:hypothetical protein